jgi:hypothetical protein
MVGLASPPDFPLERGDGSTNSARHFWVALGPGSQELCPFDCPRTLSALEYASAAQQDVEQPRFWSRLAQLIAINGQSEKVRIMPWEQAIRNDEVGAPNQH